MTFEWTWEDLIVAIAWFRWRGGMPNEGAAVEPGLPNRDAEGRERGGHHAT